MNYHPYGREAMLQLPTAVAIACLIFLASCQAELYSQLDERQANEMMQVLETQHISVSRERDKNGLSTLLIDRDEFARAVSILSTRGLPRENYKDLGEIFGKDKMVTSAFEDKMRYIHAVNQEISDSLTRIAGVTLARVHVTIPEEKKLGEDNAPSKAAVFIYHTAEADLTGKMSIIKNLIVSSVTNINYEDVTVGFFPAVQPNDSFVKANSTNSSWLVMVIQVAAIFCVVVLGMGYIKRLQVQKPLKQLR